MVYCNITNARALDIKTANYEFPRLLNLVRKLTSKNDRESPKTIPKETVDEISDSQVGVSEISSSPQQNSSNLDFCF